MLAYKGEGMYMMEDETLHHTPEPLDGRGILAHVREMDDQDHFLQHVYHVRHPVQQLHRVHVFLSPPHAPSHTPLSRPGAVEGETKVWIPPHFLLMRVIKSITIRFRV